MLLAQRGLLPTLFCALEPQYQRSQRHGRISGTSGKYGTCTARCCSIHSPAGVQPLSTYIYSYNIILVLKTTGSHLKKQVRGGVGVIGDLSSMLHNPQRLCIGQLDFGTMKYSSQAENDFWVLARTRQYCFRLQQTIPFFRAGKTSGYTSPLQSTGRSLLQQNHVAGTLVRPRQHGRRHAL